MQSGTPLADGPIGLVEVATDAPRYAVEPATSLDDRAVYGLWDIKTQRIVKLYRSRAVALKDAQFLNAVRPPLPLG